MHRFMNWREVLQIAPDAKTVDAIMRDYLKTLQPVLGSLPEECLVVLEGDVDVQAAAVTLLKAELCFDGAEEARAVLHEVAHTFAAASVRMALLHGMGQLPASQGAGGRVQAGAG